MSFRSGAMTMVSTWIIMIALVAVTEAKLADQNGNFVVVASKKLRPGQSYNFFVHSTPQCHLSIFNISVTISNKGLLASKLYTNIKKWAFLSIKIPADVSEAVYYLRASSPGEMPSQHLLKVDRKANSIVVITSRSVYKANDEVMFRIIVYDKNFRASKVEMKITIYDSENDKIFEEFKIVEGVFSSKLKLASLTRLGMWTIKAQGNHDTGECQFNVKKEGSQLFYVQLTSPEFYLLHQSHPLSISVNTIHRYGGAVKGFIKASFTYGKKEISKTVKFSHGRTDISVSSEELSLNKNDNKHQVIRVDVSVKELSSADVVTASNTVPVCLSRFQLLFLPSTRPFFRPGFTHCSQLKLSSKGHKTIPQMAKDTNSVSIAMNHDMETLCSDVVKVKTGETMEFCCEIANNVTESLQIDVVYHDKESQRNVTVSKKIHQFSMGEFGVQLSRQNKRNVVKHGSRVGFIVTSSTNISTFAFLIVCEQNLVHGESVTSENSTTHEFFYDFNFMPKTISQMVVMLYASTPKSEVAVDFLEVDIEKSFSQNVSLEVVEKEFKPEDRVELTLSGAQSSLVELYAVDAANAKTIDLFRKSKTRFPQKTLFGGSSKSLMKGAGLFVMPALSLLQSPENAWNEFQVHADQETTEVNGFGSAVVSSEVTSLVDDLKTVFWTETLLNQSGVSKLSVIIPSKGFSDSTSLFIHSFAFNKDSGFDFCTKPLKITIKSPFFFFANLPSSCFLGEEIPIRVNIHNHHHDVLQVSVTLEGSQSFKTRMCNKGDECLMTAVKLTRIIFIKSNDSKTTTFHILPLTTGHLSIQLKALSLLGTLTFKKSFLVKPEGFKNSYNRVFLMDSSPSINPSKLLLPPGESIERSSFVIKAAVYADVSLPSIENMENIHKSAKALGSEKLSSLATISYALIRLDQIAGMNQTFPEDTVKNIVKLRNKASQLINLDYQSLLTFMKIDNNGVGIVNNDASNSSVWLTAQALKVLTQASGHLMVGQATLRLTVKWLLNKQMRSGCFLESCDIDRATKKRAEDAVALTAFVTISLATARNCFNIENVEVTESIKRATTFLENNYKRHIDNPKVLSLIAHALLLTHSDQFHNALLLLEQLTFSNENLFYLNDQSLNGSQTHSLQKYMLDDNLLGASYHLMTYLTLLTTPSSPSKSLFTPSTQFSYSNAKASKPLGSLRATVVKANATLLWLLEQGRLDAAFGLMQNKIPVTEALSKYAQYAFSKYLDGKKVKMYFSLSTHYETLYRFNSSSFSELLRPHDMQVPATAKHLICSNYGNVPLLLQYGVSYQTLQCEVGKNFVQKLTTTLDDKKLNLEIQLSFGKKNGAFMVSEVFLLSGYRVREVVTQRSVWHLQQQHVLVVYTLEKIEKMTLKIIFEEEFEVPNRKPAPVVTYLTSQKDEKTMGFYSIQKPESICTKN